jgi:chromosome segregation protein
MEDVIFAACETRRRLNVAEVTLKLANENALLPRNETEVEIRRRLYRSGQNITLASFQEIFFLQQR